MLPDLPAGSGVLLPGDNLDVMRGLPDAAFQLAYLDPPFNTGGRRHGGRSRAVRDSAGHGGFSGRGYTLARGPEASYGDAFSDYRAFLLPRLREVWRVLHPTGTLYLHLDYREAHYAKVWMDQLVGRERFLNEIVWAYDYGARARRRWPAKHDTILVYVKDPSTYFFDAEGVDREPYMAPGLVTPEKAARGKLPTDVWWHTIVATSGAERTGYPTQKPVGILRRIVTASSRPGDWVLDPFAGSGTTGAAAAQLGRRFVLIDENPEACAVMRGRLGDALEE